MVPGFIESCAGDRGKRLAGDRGTRPQNGPEIVQCSRAATAAQFVEFGEKKVHRHADMAAPGQHLLVQRGQQAACVYRQHQCAQAAAPRDIGFDVGFPLLPYRIGHPGETVSGQVHQPRGVRKSEENDLAGAAGCPAGARQRGVAGDGIDGARFADVGAAGECDFGAVIAGPLRGIRGGDQEACSAQRDNPGRLARYG